MKLYMYASLRGGNGNMGIEFYFKLIPECLPTPRHRGPRRCLPLWVMHSGSHLSDEMLACE